MLAVVLVVHVAGRLATVGAGDKVDSLTYSLAAHRFWQPDATIDDLVPDKPPGQALLTGWCFRVMPGPASRLTVVPIESTFLLAAYAVFYLLGRRLFGPRQAGMLTVLFALMQNTYAAIDYTTDGFNLNENYLALPMLLAVLAHTSDVEPLRRGILRGLGLGVALSIKQTAVGLLAVLIAHDVYRWWTGCERRLPQVWAATAVGLIGGLAPVLIVLAWRGWLAAHAADVVHLSAPRIGGRGMGLPELAKIWPLVPAAWWIAVALLLRSDGSRRAPGPRESHSSATGDATSVGMLAGMWLVAETVIVWSMKIPAAHYYQQLAAPACLLAGVGVGATIEAIRGLGPKARWAAWRWVAATAAVLTFAAALPLASLASVRGRRIEPALEVRLFEEALRTNLLGEVCQQIRGGGNAAGR
ncbi:MAG: glycosyltransferase family 39 protein [Planctomycetes bacterium]|nr:glycosyltransferase family 39 protein [Planctomycetota bacterium]